MITRTVARCRAAFAALAVVSVVAGCSSAPSGSPNLVGMWTGDYSFALSDGSANKSTETLVITRQQELLLWGYEQWEENGKQMRADLTGVVTDGGKGLILTEQSGFYTGVLDGEQMTVTFTRTDPDQHTAFQVTLTHVASD